MRTRRHHAPLVVGGLLVALVPVPATEAASQAVQPLVAFSSSVYEVSEAAFSVAVAVERRDALGPAILPIAVRVWTADTSARSTAERASDYTPVETILVIQPGSSSAAVDIPLHGDHLVEADEEILVIAQPLATPAGGPPVDLGRQEAVVRILDEDGCGGTLDDATIQEAWSDIVAGLRRDAAADTAVDHDGDGFPTLAELDRFNFAPSSPTSFNPLVADVPRLDVSLDGQDMTVDLHYAVGQRTRQLSINETEETTAKTDVTTERTVKEHAFAASADYSGGFSASAGYNYTNTTTREHVVTLDWRKRVFNKEELERDTFGTVAGGTVRAAAALRNTGNVGFRIKRLSLLVHEVDPATGLRRSLVGELRPEEPWPGINLTTDGAGATKTVPVSFTIPDGGKAIALAAATSRLSITVGSYELEEIGATGTGGPHVVRRSFDEYVDAIVNRTGIVAVDFGPTADAAGRWLEGRSERHFVATGFRRNGAGFESGTTFCSAVALMLGLPSSLSAPVDVVVNNTTYRVPLATDVAGTASDTATNAYWIATASPGTLPSPAPVFDVRDVRLRKGQVAGLTFRADRDGDGAGHVVEAIFGSSDAAKDTDGDGVPDPVEIGSPILVAVAGEPSYDVFSSPTAPDADADGAGDMAERAALTDPFRWDTDGDWLADGADPAAVDASPFSAGQKLMARYPLGSDGLTLATFHDNSGSYQVWGFRNAATGEFDARVPARCRTDRLDNARMAQGWRPSGTPLFERGADGDPSGAYRPGGSITVKHPFLGDTPYCAHVLAPDFNLQGDVTFAAWIKADTPLPLGAGRQMVVGVPGFLGLFIERDPVTPGNPPTVGFFTVPCDDCGPIDHQLSHAVWRMPVTANNTWQHVAGVAQLEQKDAPGRPCAFPGSSCTTRFYIYVNGELAVAHRIDAISAPLLNKPRCPTQMAFNTRRCSGRYDPPYDVPDWGVGGSSGAIDGIAVFDRALSAKQTSHLSRNP